MSQFITNAAQIQGKPIFYFVKKQIVMPKLRKIIKIKTDDDGSLAQKRIIKQLCLKLSEQQYDEQHKQNEQFINRTCQKLKKRTKLFIDKEMSENNIQQIFKRQEDLTKQEKQKKRSKCQLNVKQLLRNMPKKVYLQQKYHNKIHMKLNILEECKLINKDKQNYKKWNNQTSNSPIKSPNFKKMTFLLQKISNSPKKKDAVDDKHREINYRVRTQKQESIFCSQQIKLHNFKSHIKKYSEVSQHNSPLWIGYKLKKEENQKYCKKIKQIKVRSSLIDL